MAKHIFAGSKYQAAIQAMRQTKTPLDPDIDFSMGSLLRGETPNPIESTRSR
jgi:hypothetical protein